MSEHPTSELRSPGTPIQPEPWLRGTHGDVPAAIRAVVHALELAKEDVELWCGPLTEEQLNARPAEIAPVAFHLRHIVRSLDRLLSYAEGKQLSGEQIASLKTELDPGAAHDALFAEFRAGIDDAVRRTQAFAGANLEEARGVGRKMLPTSVGGLLVHCADHTQRHVGQAVVTAKIAGSCEKAVSERPAGQETAS
ncbi:DinB family protein [Paracidobacterium acidisoli]|uniref:DinB family protein n=1 Tax=Paracidobacterium acidisoli TaxID=2303751 RepID=A0A372IS77_9BACT|nr:DinB family protein [Paracidobacterium acidisoli]MBT9330698.1 DinB family protein [Paracidobacterium acidisoli]